MIMKNSIRCCISCILPCGALDVIRIVHSNGRVEEISGTNIKAGDIMKAHPKHVLKKPSSPTACDDAAAAAMVPKIVVVPPDAELQRGKIYFLMPAPPAAAAAAAAASTTQKSSNNKQKRAIKRDIDSNNNNIRANSRSQSQSQSRQHRHSRSMSINNHISMSTNDLLISSDQYLSEILSEKLSTQRDRRRGRVGVWRPHLESISETPTDHI